MPRGTVSGSTPLSATPLMAMDIETTGLDPARDGIVSIGLVPMSLERIRTSASRHWILKPRVPLGEMSVTIHGITDSQVRTAPDLAELLADLLDAIAGQVLVVHCRSIERQFLNGALRTRIGEDIEFPVIDTMELEARLHRGRRPGLHRSAAGTAATAGVDPAGRQPPTLRPASLSASSRAHRRPCLGRVAAGAGRAPLCTGHAGQGLVVVSRRRFTELCIYCGNTVLRMAPCWPWRKKRGTVPCPVCVDFRRILNRSPLWPCLSLNARLPSS